MIRELNKRKLDKHRARMQTEHGDSGVEVEQTELDQALEEINEKWEAAGKKRYIVTEQQEKLRGRHSDGRGGSKEGVRKAG